MQVAADELLAGERVVAEVVVGIVGIAAEEPC